MVAGAGFCPHLTPMIRIPLNDLPDPHCQWYTYRGQAPSNLIFLYLHQSSSTQHLNILARLHRTSICKVCKLGY